MFLNLNLYTAVYKESIIFCYIKEIQCLFWIGHKINQNWIRPLQDKLLAINEIKEPKIEEELKFFLGAIQYLSKYIENLSAQTDISRQLLKKWSGIGPRNTTERSNI